MNLKCTYCFTLNNCNYNKFACEYQILHPPNMLKIELKDLNWVGDKVKELRKHWVFSFERGGEFWQMSTTLSHTTQVSHLNWPTFSELLSITIQRMGRVTGYPFIFTDKWLALITLYIWKLKEEFWTSVNFFWNSTHIIHYCSVKKDKQTGIG